MSAKHRDPQYLANARIVRAQVKRAHRFGDDVDCWRCGRSIQPGARFDVGHLDANAPATLDNLLPEHVRCNRSAGGRAGAAITNAMRSPRAPAPPARTGAPPGVNRRFAPW
jgi:hypothetical protein